MSGRHAHTRRLALVTAATVIALPLGVAMAGSAHAADGGIGGLPVDASAVTGLLGSSGLPIVGGLLGGVTGGNSAADPTAALSSVTSAADAATAGTPAAGVLQSVTGLAGGGNSAKAIKSAATPDAISGLLSNPTGGLGSVTGGNLPVVGDLGNTAGLGGVVSTVTGLTDTLGLGDTVGGLLGTVTGLVGGVTGGLLGGGIDSGDPSVHSGHQHDGRGGDDFEETALPHTGANTDATALMLCAGLAVAGTGVTLVSRRRRGALSI
jgi:LPXTG cell wall anchor motif